MLDGRWKRPDVRVTPQPETLADNVESLLFFIFGCAAHFSPPSG